MRIHTSLVVQRVVTNLDKHKVVKTEMVTEMAMAMETKTKNAKLRIVLIMMDLIGAWQKGIYNGKG